MITLNLRKSAFRPTGNARFRKKFRFPVDNAVSANRPNPLRADPSHTAGERRAFIVDIRRRFANLRKALRELIVKEDAFGLIQSHDEQDQRASDLVDNTSSIPSDELIINTRWKFHSSTEQLKAFRKWLAAQMKVQGLFFDRQRGEDEWWRRYIEQTYRKGAGRAFDDANAAWRRRAGIKNRLDFYEGTREQFLRSSFNRPAAVAKVKTLAARTYTDLKGFSDEMATKAQRVLVDGMIAGKHPREIAAELESAVNVSERRAETIARTEIIRAHAEGQLEALSALGVEEVGVAVEWSTAGDDRVCSLCEPMEGAVLSLEEARKVSIPRHPNCRCAWVPANVGETSSGQLRRRGEITSAIRTSLERDSEGSDWAEDADISKGRPKDIFNVFCPTGEGGGVDPTCSPAVGSSIADVLAAQRGDREAMGRVVEQNQGLVRKLARKYAKNDANLRDDLISEGNLGLIRAVEKFDPEKGVKFVTYAHQWISGMQRNEVRRQAKERTRAGELKLDPEDLSGGVHAIDEARDVVSRALGSLDARSADILSASFGLGGEAQTHREIAARLGITPARVGQIEKAALAKLRELQPVAANLLANVFCPTGEGGGIDPSCSSGEKETKTWNLSDNVFCPTGPGGGVKPDCPAGGGGETEIESTREYTGRIRNEVLRAEARVQRRAAKYRKIADELAIKADDLFQKHLIRSAQIEAEYKAGELTSEQRHEELR